MVETITPVVHGGSRARWAASLLAHVAGATIAAAALGAMLGAAGALLGAPWGAAGTALVAALGGLYLARELGVAVPVPQLRRQVPEWWRTFFPPGVAAFLYGIGLGPGFLTYLSHGTLVVVAVAAVASGRPLLGAGLLAGFGLARGMSLVVALDARTPVAGAALVERLGRAAPWVGWRAANAIALSSVLALALVRSNSIEGPAEPAALAAAVLTVAFGGAAVSKLARPRTWRRALASSRLPRKPQRVASFAVPAVELGVALMPLLGFASAAGMSALLVLGVFTAVIVVARVRVGRRLVCGCFGSSTGRDYRSLLARNAALAGIAALAWRGAADAPVVRSLGVPAGGDLLPAALAVAGLVLAAWVGARTLVALGRRATR
jgi:hypothetical protein